ncbi:hypothetical protein ACFCWT_26750 [Streptomyces olivaceus]|uniref:hypothetical protein n=1 Tax=Streptomyces olivaceus TaxID=47716 RepID=UPI0035E150F8
MTARAWAQQTAAKARAAAAQLPAGQAVPAAPVTAPAVAVDDGDQELFFPWGPDRRAAGARVFRPQSTAPGVRRTQATGGWLKDVAWSAG